MSDTSGFTHLRSPARLFRAVAVERYTQPVEADVPEMLQPSPRRIVTLGICLLILAIFALSA